LTIIKTQGKEFTGIKLLYKRTHYPCIHTKLSNFNYYLFWNNFLLKILGFNTKVMYYKLSGQGLIMSRNIGICHQIHNKHLRATQMPKVLRLIIIHVSCIILMQFLRSRAWMSFIQATHVVTLKVLCLTWYGIPHC